MGILDDAINEHLELKRRHGAREAEVHQLQADAFEGGDRPDLLIGENPFEASGDPESAAVEIVEPVEPAASSIPEPPVPEAPVRPEVPPTVPPTPTAPEVVEPPMPSAPPAPEVVEPPMPPAPTAPEVVAPPVPSAPEPRPPSVADSGPEIVDISEFEESETGESPLPSTEPPAPVAEAVEVEELVDDEDLVYAAEEYEEEYVDGDEAAYEQEYVEEKPKKRGLFGRRKRDKAAHKREIAASYPTEEHPPPPAPGTTDQHDLVPPPPGPPSDETQEHPIDGPSDVYEVPAEAYEPASDELSTIAPESGEGPAPFDFEETATGESIVYEETYTEEEVIVYEEPVEPAAPVQDPAPVADAREALAEEEEGFADEVAGSGSADDDDDLWFERKPPEDFEFDEER